MPLRSVSFEHLAQGSITDYCHFSFRAPTTNMDPCLDQRFQTYSDPLTEALWVYDAEKGEATFDAIAIAICNAITFCMEERELTDYGYVSF